MIPGFIRNHETVNKQFFGKMPLFTYDQSIIPMDIDTCYETCRSSYCICWETPDGGCEPGSEFCRSGYKDCLKNCRRIFG